MPMNDDAHKLLRQPEGRLLERKLEGASRSDYRKALVAFANSVGEDEVGVLVVGVQDDGTVRGVSDADSLQRKLRSLAQKDCYPPIDVTIDVVNDAGLHVVAVQVRHSRNRPHFAGPAFVRTGSESVNATERQYEELIASRHEICGAILARKNDTWIVRTYGRRLDNPKPLEDTYSEHAKCVIVECTAQFVKLKKLDSGIHASVSLRAVEVSWDDMLHCPLLLIHKWGR